jgi:hypothetical protein
MALAGVSLAAFVLGMSFAEGLRPTAGSQHATGPCEVTGTVHYATDRGVFPDAESVVLLLPADELPSRYERPAPDGLTAGDSPPDARHAGVQAIQAMQGAYARANEDGHFRLRVPRGGNFFLLAISRHLQRDGDQSPSRADLAQLGRYVLPATELLGGARYEWRRVVVENGTEVDVNF